MRFVTQALVRFAHVDAAGIVFYPRYFEIVSAAVEDFFAQGVGADFCSLHLERGIGVPMVRLEAEFVRPSRLGDVLDIAIEVARLGTSSVMLSFDIRCKDQQRLKVESVLVCTALQSGRAEPWPDDVRAKLSSR